MACRCRLAGGARSGHRTGHAGGGARANYGQVVLQRRLQDSLARLNPSLPPSALDGALRRLTHPEGATLEARNRSFHRMLVAGVNVEYRASDGAIRGGPGTVINFDRPEDDDWLAVNQFTVTETANENRNTRRPDIVLFLNGLPVGIIELKNPADEGMPLSGPPGSSYKPTSGTLQPVLHERGPHRLRRPGRSHRDSHRRQGVVQALAHCLRRSPGRASSDRVAGDVGRGLPTGSLSGPAPRLYRV